ncbi:MAG: phosphoadenylyl-sulfate reductase [Alphaproteobacteria bacterium]|nr:phosphoadenylyl-sulfate reductase [Alphaproteobacteria bacterium]
MTAQIHALTAEADEPDTVAVSAAAERLAGIRERTAGLEGPDLLRAAITREFPGRITLVSSFGAEAAVLLHMVAQIDPTVPVLFLNTGKLFGETLRYRDRLQDMLGLADVRSLHPLVADEKAADPDGGLWSRDPDACCHFRKVLPLRRALKGFDAEITGRKRFQTRARAAMEAVEWADGRFKINPLANWTLDGLKAYAEAHRLPPHPLVADGYLSIGCMPCTERVAEGGDYRSGRWVGRDKEECGIHQSDLTDGAGI